MMQVFDHTKRSYPCRIGGTIIMLFLMSMFWMPGGADATPPMSPKQKIFVSPEEGANAMIAAMKMNDVKMLTEIFGPIGNKLIFSSDANINMERRETFVTSYEEKNRFEMFGSSIAILYTGKDDWPFPIPLVKTSGGWHFDTKAGKEEMLNRVIGRNELNAVQVCLAYVDAQREYALGDHDRDGFFEYAQKFVSDPDQRNGLFWETQEGEKPSPLGPAIARASKESCGKMSSTTCPPLPYHGYYYKILKAQGKNTPGGAYDYIANGKMIGGFALVAYPAEYGHSGIMTFIVHMDGIVYEKNLGKNSANTAEALKMFDPDKSWKIAEYGHAVK
ncbi:MAG: DUF2950 domain-containing protein [Deltaproteobacteria bacterium]|nr:DUF2950 domain-containing protein [Deltaproteobacteria bacterium]